MAEDLSESESDDEFSRDEEMKEEQHLRLKRGHSIQRERIFGSMYG